MDNDRTWLRHAVATLAYRGGKVLRGAPESIADIRVCPTSRSTVEILAHIGDLLEWARSMALGEESWSNAAPRSWCEEVDRLYAGLEHLDEALSAERSLPVPALRLFHGPLADALTHVGQIATLRRLAGSPVRGENYFQADIEVGRVGDDQPAAKREFD